MKLIRLRFRLYRISARRGRFWFQLKSQKSRIGDSITDGAYAAMMNAIRHDETPHFYFMQYEIVSPSPPSGDLSRLGNGERNSAEGEGPRGPSEREQASHWARGEVARLIKSPRPDPLPAKSRGEGTLWLVRNLLLVPSFAFPPSAIIKRKPLSSAARRAGWVGCNIALNRVPAEARIPVVITRSSSRRRGNETPSEKSNQRFLTSSPTNQTVIVPPEEVRERFKRVKPLKDISVTQRGWTLDVLNIVRRWSIRRGELRETQISGRWGFV